MGKNYCKKGCWYIGEYLEDLAVNESLIPENIRSFIMDNKSYLFDHKESLHDSWLTSFKYSFLPNGKKDELVIKFLGAYHNVEYQFIFKDILSIKFKYEDKNLHKVDLIMHLFSVCKNDIYNYDFVFADTQKISIKFKKLVIVKIPIKK